MNVWHGRLTREERVMFEGRGWEKHHPVSVQPVLDVLISSGSREGTS